MKELSKYHFGKGRDYLLMDNLAMKIKDALVIEHIEKFQYFVGAAEIKFTEAMCLRSLREWMYEMDQGPSSALDSIGRSVLTVTIQCVGDWTQVEWSDFLGAHWKSVRRSTLAAGPRSWQSDFL